MADARANLDALIAAGATHVKVKNAPGDVCPSCAAVNGKVFAVGDAKGYLPLHPLCKCGWERAEVEMKSQATLDADRAKLAAAQAVLGPTPPMLPSPASGSFAERHAAKMRASAERSLEENRRLKEETADPVTRREYQELIDRAEQMIQQWTAAENLARQRSLPAMPIAAQTPQPPPLPMGIPPAIAVGIPIAQQAPQLPTGIPVAQHAPPPPLPTGIPVAQRSPAPPPLATIAPPIPPEPSGGDSGQSVVNAPGPSAGGIRPPQLPAGPFTPIQGGGGNVDWVKPAVGLLGDLTHKWEGSGKKPAAPFQFPESGVGASMSPGAPAADSTKELAAVMKELSAAVKKLTDVMLQQSRGGGAMGGAAGTPVAPNPQATFNLLKQAVAGSGNAMLGRQAGTTVANPGPLQPGGAAQSAGAAPSATQPSATGAVASAQRRRNQQQQNA